MPRFRKKPIVIEAWHNVAGGELMPQWVSAAVSIFTTVGGELQIQTLEGVMTCGPGDWVLKGVKDEVYPCRKDIFEATYETVE